MKYDYAIKVLVFELLRISEMITLAKKYGMEISDDCPKEETELQQAIAHLKASGTKPTTSN